MRRTLKALALAGVLLLAMLWAIAPPAARHLSLERDPLLVRGAIHVHTTVSDGAGTPDEVAAAAARAGLDFVILTDHGDGTRLPVPPRRVSGVLVIDAVEISTTGGHYLGLGLGQTPYRLAGEPRDVIEDVTRLGGFGIAAHPDSPKLELAWHEWQAPFQGLEWLNADSAWRDEPRSALVRTVVSYWLRPAEAVASLFDRPSRTLARWDALARRRAGDCDCRSRRPRAAWATRYLGVARPDLRAPPAVVRVGVQDLLARRPAAVGARHRRVGGRDGDPVRNSRRSLFLRRRRVRRASEPRLRRDSCRRARADGRHGARQRGGIARDAFAASRRRDPAPGEERRGRRARRRRAPVIRAFRWRATRGLPRGGVATRDAGDAAGAVDCRQPHSRRPAVRAEPPRRCSG